MKVTWQTVVLVVMGFVGLTMGGVLTWLLGTRSLIGSLAGVALIGAGLFSLASVPRLGRENALARGPFVPLAAVAAVGVAPQPNAEVMALASMLAERLQGTPYAVEVGPDAVRVSWNVADYRYRTMLYEHKVEQTFSTVIAQTGRPGVWMRRDGQDRFDAVDGVLHSAAWHTRQSGAIWQASGYREITFGEGGPQVTKEHVTNSSVVSKAVKDAIARLGGKLKRDVTAEVGVAFALAGVLAALFAVTGLLS